MALLCALHMDLSPLSLRGFYQPLGKWAPRDAKMLPATISHDLGCCR